MERIAIELGRSDVLLDELLKNGLPVAHDCNGALACGACCVVVREGAERLDPPEEDELDMLDRTGAPDARLACRVKGEGAIVVELPPLGARALHAVSPIMLSEAAARHLSAQLRRQAGAAALRLSIQPSGCSGFGYRIDVADAVRADDQVYESRGVRIVVDPASLPFVQGTSIDLGQEGLSRRLRFDNPNARQSCGCGKSFSA
jgi:iron-sulfur cluster assembly protein